MGARHTLLHVAKGPIQKNRLGKEKAYNYKAENLQRYGQFVLIKSESNCK